MSLDNISKVLKYVDSVAKHDFIANGHVYHKSCRDVSISSTIFLKDNCNMCGRCCVAEDIMLTQFEYDNLMNYDMEDLKKYVPPLPSTYMENLKKALRPVKVTISDCQVTRSEDTNKDVIKENEESRHDIYMYKAHLPLCNWTYPDRGTIQRCSMMFQIHDNVVGCGIHPIRSITCRMPHLNAVHNNKYGTYIGVKQFGRNWLLGCPVKLQKPTLEDFEIAKADKIDKLSHLNKNCEDVGVETWLPETLNILNQIEYKDYLEILAKHHIIRVSKQLDTSKPQKIINHTVPLFDPAETFSVETMPENEVTSA